MVHINHRSIDVTHTMAKDIDRNHRQGVLVLALLDNILLPAILRPQILSKPQSLRFQPCLLQFDEHQMLMAILLPYGCPEVDAKHRDAVACGVHILVRTLLHLHHLFLQQCGQHRPSYTLIFHQVFEYRVIYRVRKIQFHVKTSFSFIAYDLGAKYDFSWNYTKIARKIGQAK